MSRRGRNLADLPYTTKTGTLKPFFETLQKVGIPPKVTLHYLRTIGFASSGDRPIIPILQFLGFIHDAGTPTGIWKTYRDRSKAPKVLGLAIKTAYSDLCYRRFGCSNCQLRSWL